MNVSKHTASLFLWIALKYLRKGVTLRERENMNYKKLTSILGLSAALVTVSCGNSSVPSSDHSSGESSNAQIWYPSATKIYDDYKDGYHEESNEYVLPDRDQTLVTRSSTNGRFSVGGKEIALPGYSMCLYIADFNRDGYPELCLGCSLGSGIINESIYIYDYHNEQELLVLSDRKEHDYFLDFYAGGDHLFVLEYPVMKREPLLRYGALGYDNSGTLIVNWVDVSSSS